MHAYVSLPVNLRLVNAGQKAANRSLIPRRYQLAAVYKLLQAAGRLLEGCGLDQFDPSQRPPVITGTLSTCKHCSGPMWMPKTSHIALAFQSLIKGASYVAAKGLRDQAHQCQCSQISANICAGDGRAKPTLTLIMKHMAACLRLHLHEEEEALAVASCSYSKL